MVEVSLPAPVAVQKEPSPWVGSSSTSPGSRASRLMEMYCSRARVSARSGPCQPVDGDVLQPGQGVRALGPQEVRPPGRADEQAAAGEEGDLGAVDEDEVAGVLRGVAGGVDRADAEAVLALEVLEVERGGVAVRRGRGRRQDQLGAGPEGRLLPAGHVVVVQVGLEDETQVDVVLPGRGQEAVDVPLRIDQDALALVLEQVGLVPEPRRAERDDLHACPSRYIPSGV
jgi:hypothetical protein